MAKCVNYRALIRKASRLGVSQCQLADQAGLAQPVVSKIARGVGQPSYKSSVFILEAFNKLLPGEDAPTMSSKRL